MRVSNFLHILLIAALAGYSAWARSTGGSSATPPGERSIAVPDHIRLIDRAEAEALWHQPDTLFLDVRTATDYQYGHIQGALSLPSPTAADIAERKPELQQARVLVVYCSSTACGKSVWAAMRLRDAGLTQAVIYPEGWNEWSLAKLPAVARGTLSRRPDVAAPFSAPLWWK